MSGRVFVVIFFFWAILTILTPTLILLSESSKLDLELHGNKIEGVKTRKMMADLEKHLKTSLTPPTMKAPAMQLAPAPAPAPAPALAPAPAPAPASRIEKPYQKQ